MNPNAAEPQPADRGTEPPPTKNAIDGGRFTCRRGLRPPNPLLVILCGASMVSCGRNAPSPELATNGDTEVTAKLTAIGGDFPPNKLYDYMYVMKYHVLKVH